MSVDFQRELGGRLRVAREGADITRPAVAKRLGLSLAAVQHHENGTRGVSNELLAKYCRLYNIRIGWLVEGSGRMTRDADEVQSLIEAISDDAKRKTWLEMGRLLAGQSGDDS